jgi:cardiolipin synthase
MPELPWFDIFAISYFAWVVLACITLLLDRRSPTATLAWIFAFFALPVVSGLYYMVFGPRRLQRRRRRYSAARGTIASRLGHAEDHAHLPKLDPDAAGLAAVARRLEQGDPTFASAVTLLDDGDAFFAALAESIRGARHHVHMEYYIWEPDEVGTQFRDLLAEAAARGVEVRVLYDSVGSKN